MNVHIRKPKIEYFEEFLEIRNMCREMLHNPNKFEMNNESVDWFNANIENYSYIHNDDMKIIGYFRFSKCFDAEDCMYVGLDLHPCVRGQGLAKDLYIDLIKRKNTERVHSLKLEVLSHNEVAMRLYKSLGFLVSKIDINYDERFGVVVDNVHMQLNLDHSVVSGLPFTKHVIKMEIS